MRTFFLEKEKAYSSHSSLNTRFESKNEIEYCVGSILKFAPFVRNIFIITDSQAPKFSDIFKKYFPKWINSIKIIDHKEIFKGNEFCLPTFNSRSIESLLWKINSLSDNFVYFNDDFFLIRPVKQKDWFVNGTPVLRGKWKSKPKIKLAYNTIIKCIKKTILNNKNFMLRPNYYIGQWNAANKLGYINKYFRVEHTPHPINKKTLKLFFNNNDKLLKKNISYRFRNYDQFNTVSLANNLELQNQNIYTSSIDGVYIYPVNRHKKYVEKKLNLCTSNENIKFICVQSLDSAKTKDEKAIKAWLKSIIFKMTS
jgi:hypothetical protein